MKYLDLFKSTSLEDVKLSLILWRRDNFPELLDYLRENSVEIPYEPFQSNKFLSVLISKESKSESAKVLWITKGRRIMFTEENLWTEKELEEDCKQEGIDFLNLENYE